MKAIILARVSDKKQDSNEAQVNRVLDYTRFKNLTIWKTYEIEESSTKGDREKFQEVVAEIVKSNEPIALVVDTVDRLQRSFRESVQLDDLRKSGKLEIHFYRENLVIRKDSNSADLLRWDMAVMFARSYVLQLSDNVKRKQEEMIRVGIYPSKPPRGYKRDPLSLNPKEVVIDDYNSKVVKKAFELYATGAYSLDLLTKKLNEDYRVNWCKGFTDKVLKDPFYYGFMTWNGKQYPHKYQKIITKELFDQVQQVKAGFCKKPFKYAGKPYFYRGMLRCSDCGLAITPEKHRGHVYYHCTQYRGKHGGKWITEEDITEQVGSVFKKMQLSEEVVNKIVDSLKSSHEGKSDFREEQNKKLVEERELYSKRSEKIYMDHLDGRITDEEYDRYYQLFRSQIADIDGRIAMLQDAEDNYYITAKYVLELSNRAYDLFKNSEVEQKRQLMKLVLLNMVLDGKKVRFQVQKPFNTILNYSDSKLMLREPWINITVDFNAIIQAFQDLRYIGELRQRWDEIKKLNSFQVQPAGA